jgi:hypothetical protein
MIFTPVDYFKNPSPPSFPKGGTGGHMSNLRSKGFFVVIPAKAGIQGGTTE